MNALLVLALLVGGVSDRPRAAGVHPPSTQLLLNDDVKLCLGDSCDAWLLYDFGNTRLEFENLTGIFLRIDDGGIATVFPGAMTLQSTLDVEGYASIGNGMAVDAKKTLCLDRDFSSATTANQLFIDGIITITGGTSQIFPAFIMPGGVVINSGNTHPVVATLGLTEPVITETSGDVTEAATLYIADAPTEGDSNYALHVVSGATQLDGTLGLAPYTAEIEINAGTATLGPTAPTWDQTKDPAYAGLGFDADAESVNWTREIPACWGGQSNWTLEIYWSNASGDAIAAGETVKWDIQWRSIIWGTEAVDNGTIATGTVTYTQPGGGDADGATYKSEITIPYTGGNQPLAAGDLLGMHFDRDVTTDTYSGKGIVVDWHLDFTADKICPQM